jgi:hypothetical protein
VFRLVPGSHHQPSQLNKKLRNYQSSGYSDEAVHDAVWPSSLVPVLDLDGVPVVSSLC